MSARRRVVVIGDCLLDRDVDGRVDRVCPDAPAPVVDVESETAGPGGAGLTALLCVEEGVDVTLVAPLAEDAEGAQLRALLEAAGVCVVGLGHEGGTRVKTRLLSGGQVIARIDTGGPGHPVGGLTAAGSRAVEEADVVLVSCYGGGTTADDDVRAALARRAPRAPIVWDPHPRGGEPVPGCALVTPNLPEARAQAGMPDDPGDVVARRLVELWSVRAVAVTGGSAGAWVASTVGEPLHAPAVAASGDSCGAGDRFASAAAVALARGRTTSEAVVDAVARAGEFVAAGGASGFRERERAMGDGGPLAGAAAEVSERSRNSLLDNGTNGYGEARYWSRTSLPDRGTDLAAEEAVASLRRAGGILVATGGCFDVLHAGHVAMLEAARALGDSLVVLLNSDTSVRRLKGNGRPVHSQDDRARVLLGLACVDAVLVFDDDDPREALQSLQPQVWTKGGDYEDTDLPEADLVRSWGGRVVLLPYLSGRSTTAVLQSISSGENL